MNDLEKHCKMWNNIYDALVKIGGAPESSRDAFVQYHIGGGGFEWRFMGHLGFGGKYRSKTNKVDCYKERETPVRIAIINKLNEVLANIAQSDASV